MAKEKPKYSRMAILRTQRTHGWPNQAYMSLVISDKPDRWTVGMLTCHAPTGALLLPHGHFQLPRILIDSPPFVKAKNGGGQRKDRLNFTYFQHIIRYTAKE